MAAHARRKKRILNGVKGFRGRRKNCNRLAKDAYNRKMNNQFIGRKIRKRNFRRLWIVRLNGILRGMGLKYSQVMGMFKEGYRAKDATVLNRRSLSEIAFHHPHHLKDIIRNMIEGTSHVQVQA